MSEALYQDILAKLSRPTKVVVTAGMPYVNGELHLGHLAGVFVPADIYARWWRMVVGRENVVFVSGSDDHGVEALGAFEKSGKPLAAFISSVRSTHQNTLASYAISLDVYASTSDPKDLPDHTQYCHEFLQALNRKDQLSVRSTEQYYDTQRQCFLPDRWVRGTCPVCGYGDAYSQECPHCGAYYESTELGEPRSALSGTTPELRSTRHLWWDMFPQAPLLWQHIQSSRSLFPKAVYQQLCGDMAPALNLGESFEESAALLKQNQLSYKKMNQKGGGVRLQFSSFEDLKRACELLEAEGVVCEVHKSWARRFLSRDTFWGVSLPEGLGLSLEERKQKSFYVWPDSLIAPLSFTKRALRSRGEEEELYLDYWGRSTSERHQFIGVDNLYFYGLMQSALWQASWQGDEPEEGEWQMSRIHSRFHLQVEGEKMSKSRGNFYTADELLQDRGYSSDQIRYFLATLSLRDKPSNLEFSTLERRNNFLAGPLNAAFEKPLAAAHSKFGGRVPEGQLLDKVRVATEKVMRQYVKFMPQAQYPQFLGAVENYARIINSIFHSHKPHDDRHALEERKDGLYSSFYILKNLLIWLYPFAPDTMERLRKSLGLGPEVYTIDELATGIRPGHKIGVQERFFPSLSQDDSSEKK